MTDFFRIYFLSIATLMHANTDRACGIKQKKQYGFYQAFFCKDWVVFVRILLWMHNFSILFFILIKFSLFPIKRSTKMKRIFIRCIGWNNQIISKKKKKMYFKISLEILLKFYCAQESNNFWKCLSLNTSHKISKLSITNSDHCIDDSIALSLSQ